MEPTVRIVIEDADGVLRVTADRPVRVLLIRYDDMLADPQAENLAVDLDPQRVDQLFRIHGQEVEE